MIRTIFNVGGHPPHPPFLYIFIFSFNIQDAKDAEINDFLFAVERTAKRNHSI